jgi:hypothetical protein
VRDGRVLGTRISATDAHPMRAEPSMGQASFCAPCHQFRFPRGQRQVAYDPADWLQTTYDEWQASSAAREGRPCTGCHDPHAVPAWTPTMFSHALQIEIDARRNENDVHVRARITPDRIGHSFPTGDMFRRAELVLEGSQRRSIVYQRFFAMMPSSRGTGFRLRPVDDARIPASGSTREIVLAGEQQTRLGYRLLLHRLDPAVASRRGLSPSETTIVVRAGNVNVQ